LKESLPNDSIVHATHLVSRLKLCTIVIHPATVPHSSFCKILDPSQLCYFSHFEIEYYCD
ncbi:hypothetical protein T10_11535, partial [Trichinella papuae]